MEKSKTAKHPIKRSSRTKPVDDAIEKNFRTETINRNRKKPVDNSIEEDFNTETIDYNQKAGLKKFIIPNFRKFISLILILILSFLALSFLNKIYAEKTMNEVKTKKIPTALKKLINNDTIPFEVLDIKDQNGVYEFNISVGQGQNKKQYTFYMTKNAEVLFTSGIKLSTFTTNPPAADTNQQVKKLTCNDLTKKETPILTAFVVSQCPFGLQMQRVFKKTIEEQPGLLPYLQIKYIGVIQNGQITSMHGNEEAQENLRQICIRDEQKDKYWDYVGCYMKEGKTDQCLATSAVDTSTLNSCMNDASKGLKYAQKDFEEANRLGVSGSPTLFINGTQRVSEFDFGGRTANAIKTLICCGSKNQGDFCKTDLSQTQIATSFSLNDQTSNPSTTTSAAGCGQ